MPLLLLPSLLPARALNRSFQARSGRDCNDTRWKLPPASSVRCPCCCCCCCRCCCCCADDCSGWILLSVRARCGLGLQASFEQERNRAKQGKTGHQSCKNKTGCKSKTEQNRHQSCKNKTGRENMSVVEVVQEQNRETMPVAGAKQAPAMPKQSR